MAKRKSRQLSDENIRLIAETYKNWREKKNYDEVIGFCRSADINEVEENNFALSPSRYVSTIKQEINLDVTLHDPKISRQLKKVEEKLIFALNNILSVWGKSGKTIDIKNILDARLVTIAQ